MVDSANSFLGAMTPSCCLYACCVSGQAAHAQEGVPHIAQHGQPPAVRIDELLWTTRRIGRSKLAGQNSHKKLGHSSLVGADSTCVC
jgi:hypothetical protein